MKKEMYATRENIENNIFHSRKRKGFMLVASFALTEMRRR